MISKVAVDDGVTVYAREFPSYTQPGVVYYTRVVVAGNKIIKATCSCPAFAMGRECYHIKKLKNHVEQLLGGSA